MDLQELVLWRDLAVARWNQMNTPEK